MAPRWSQDALRCIQVGLKFKHVEIYKNIEKSKEFQGFLGGLGGLIEPKTAQDGAKTGQGAPRKRFGRLLEPLGVILGHLGGVLGRLGAPWRAFGASWRRLWVVLEVS